MQNTIIAVDKSGSYRLYLTVTTEMVKKASKIHSCTPLASAALGRTLSAAGMMGLMLKSEQDKLTIRFKGDGPAKEILACANAKGEVKGYISNPYVNLPIKENGKLDVGKAVGNGKLTVIKDLGLKEPYVGQIDLISGEIAEDLTQYFTISEQEPSSVALGVRIDEKGEVSAAGGMIIQILPNPKEECIAALEDMLFYMDSLSLLVQDAQKVIAQNPVDTLFSLIFKNIKEEFMPIILDRREISWNCDCSKERMAAALVSLGRKDLRQLIDEDQKAQLTCQFCQSSYDFTKEELEKIWKEAQ